MPSLASKFMSYINDLPEIFVLDGDDPITIENTKLSRLKYADDLIIISTSRDGLQK